jgi:hypothetical protein
MCILIYEIKNITMKLTLLQRRSVTTIIQNTKRYIDLSYEIQFRLRKWSGAPVSQTIARTRVCFQKLS